MNRVFDFLADTFLYDMQVFQDWWFLAPFYLVWFCVKWLAITIPLWGPTRMVLSSFTAQNKDA